MESQPSQRLHPLLATPDEAHGDQIDSIYSDHLPILVTMPVYETDDALQVITWNVLDENRPYGYKMPGVDDSAETIPDPLKRADRIVDALQRWLSASANKNIPHADVIVLQEVGSSLLPKLNKLAETHHHIGICSDGQGKATLYNQDKLALDPDYIKEEALLEGGMVNRFQCGGDDGPYVVITNVHMGHQDLPEETEDKITAVIKENNKKENNNILVIGDFNCRIVPSSVGQVTELLVTAVCPSSYRRGQDGEERGQGADWTDGGFCLGSDGEIVQLENRELDPQTGMIFNPAMSKSDVSNFLQGCNEFQREELQQFRTWMCCADAFQVGNDFSSGQSFLKFQEFLRESIGDKSLLVRPAANAFNDKGMCIASANKEFIQTLAASLPDDHVQISTCESRMGPMTAISVPSRHLPALESAVYSALGVTGVC